MRDNKGRGANRHTPLEKACLNASCGEVVDALLGTAEGRRYALRRANGSSNLMHLLAGHWAGQPLGLALEPAYADKAAAKFLAFKEGRRALAFTDGMGCTPLFLAVNNKRVDLFKCIMATPEGEASVATPQASGATPLHRACRGALDSLKQMAKLLLASPRGRACCALRDRDGRTPLYDACYWRVPETVQEILDTEEGRRSALLADNKGLTPLHVLCALGFSAIAGSLLAAEGGREAIAAACGRGQTPLHVIASVKGRNLTEEELQVAQALIGTAEAKAALRLLDVNGLMPAALARNNEHERLTPILEGHHSAG